MARLFADENFPRPTVMRLRQLGHDVTTIQEEGKGGCGVLDPDVLDLAIASDRAVLTIDRKGFNRLHRSRPNHSGIVVSSEFSDFTEQATLIHAAILPAGDLHGKLIRVNRPPR
ncbi:MAG: DUF5615 family PIN-like protein [Planctomycetes bacterium]|nr:DUF5615 family PIN-like protein [Planctomycetota bacterium]